MDECKLCQSNLAGFSDEALTTSQELAFLNHICECDECMNKLELYLTTKYGLNDYDEALIVPKYRRYVKFLEIKELIALRIEDRFRYLEWKNDNDRLTKFYMLVTNMFLAIVVVVLAIIKFC